MYKYKKEDPTTYCVGTTLTLEALRFKPDSVKRVYISPKQKKDETYAKVVSLAKERRIPVIENNEKIFKDVSQKDNCMVLGEFEKFHSSLREDKNHVVLVNPSNLGNLGTILRSCFGFYIEDVALITPCADPFDPKTVRASMGALFHLRLALYPDFISYQKEFPEHHLHPFMLQTDSPLKEADKTEPWSLVFGNEATGLDASFLKVGQVLKIPQNPGLDSLNLDNAVSIGLYEFSR
ncbi:MAG: TrmH family RNA methyltransferase [Candidatus Enteromonas sp.]|nr:TrmH family RNA methyltransferase [bacterium]MDY6100565.1 TrmH family RNA methyltransferase [Candidatus Enteromonas sp.]